jgi:hypothetical protein
LIAVNVDGSRGGIWPRQVDEKSPTRNDHVPIKEKDAIIFERDAQTQSRLGQINHWPWISPYLIFNKLLYHE